MSTGNLSLVTSVLRRLLLTNMERLAGVAAQQIKVTCGYPESQVNADRTINLHLYHISEDQFRRNCPGPGTDHENVSTTPLALTLYYVLTAHHVASEAHDWQTEQQIMGYALKTFHDFPTISDATMLVTSTGTVVAAFPETFRNLGNIIDIVLRPLTPEDSIAYWAADQEQPVRLSAYYEVRTVLMDPEPSRVEPGIVLSVGQSVTPRAELALTATVSELAFRRPASIAASLPGSVRVSPARPALDSPVADPLFPDNSRFRILGAGLAGGLARRLMVRSDRWRAQGVPFGEIAIAPGPSQATRWGLEVGPESLDLRIGGSLSYVDEDGNAGVATVLPGVYSAAMEIVTAYRTAGATTREVTLRSNEVVFTVTPRIHRADPPVTIPGAPGAPAPADEDRHRITVRIAPGIQLDAGTGGIDRLDIRLIIDGASYERVDAFNPIPALNDGLFTVAASSVTFQPYFDASTPGIHMVRLVVEGADAQPFWIEI